MFKSLDTPLKSLFILGRQSNLGMAELESLFEDQNIIQFNEKLAASETQIPPETIDKLGGTVKIANVLAKIRLQNWSETESYLKTNLVQQITELPEGKIDFGISLYGMRVTPREITNLSLSIKKLVKARGRSIRIIPNQNTDLSSAQVIHNHLTSPSGFELIIAADNQTLLFGKTIAIQNIYNYAARDQERPKRDAKVGMLPPKLAQIMINLTSPKPYSIILDPFCGTGVILQEALLMGYQVFGTDLDARMVDYSRYNLDWLEEKIGQLPERDIQVGDATKMKWNAQVNCIVSETYLGKPLFKLPPRQELLAQANDISKLIEDFLVNLSTQINSSTRLCIAVPAWNTKEGFLSLPLLDHLEKIGYNHISLKLVDTNSLIYHRPDQLVARQLLVIIRK